MGVSVDEILDDFKSIKLTPAKREYVNEARSCLHRTGGLSIHVQDVLRKMYRVYSRQVSELHASRERAKATNWRIREGVSAAGAAGIIESRQKEVSERKGDLGI